MSSNGDASLPAIMPRRHSRCLELKYKANLTKFDTGVQYGSLKVLNLLSDDTLLAIAYTCDIEMESESTIRSQNLGVLRKVKSFRKNIAKFHVRRGEC